MRVLSSPTRIAVAPAGIPPWAPLPGQYATVSINDPLSLDPCPANKCIYSGNEGFTAIWDTWNGGAFAPTLGAMGSLLLFGGGHFAYFGNSVLAYDVAARTFQRLSDPAPYDLSSVAANGAYPNGTPYPNHTNMGCEYLPPEAGGGALGSYAFVSHDQTGVNIINPTLWLFDLATRQWRASVSGLPPTFPAMCYDSLRKGLWVVGGGTGRLVFVDVRSGVKWTLGAGSADGKVEFGWYGNIVHVPSRDCLLFCMKNGQIDIIVLSGIGTMPPASGVAGPRFTIQQAGIQCPSLQSRYDTYTYACERLEYCPADGNLYMLDCTSLAVAQLYKLTPPRPADPINGVWAWTSEVLSAKNGEALALDSAYAMGDDRRFYGKFRYVPALTSFVFSDRGEAPAQMLRSATAL